MALYSTQHAKSKLFPTLAEVSEEDDVDWPDNGGGGALLPYPEAGKKGQVLLHWFLRCEGREGRGVSRGSTIQVHVRSPGEGPCE